MKDTAKTLYEVSKIIGELKVIKYDLDKKIEKLEKLTGFSLDDYKSISKVYRLFYDQLQEPVGHLPYDNEEEKRLHDIMFYVKEWDGFPTEEELQKAKEKYEKEEVERMKKLGIDE
jgi:hypothetical protein